MAADGRIIGTMNRGKMMHDIWSGRTNTGLCWNYRFCWFASPTI